jgi:ABC-2 type transport system permease protein
MTRSLRAEVLKLVTTRTLLWLLLGELLVVALTVFSTVASAKPDTLVGYLHEQQFTLLALINVGLFSLIVGLRAFTDEFRYSTIVQTFLSDPSRTTTLYAKVVAAVAAAAAMAAVSLAALAALALGLASAKGGHLYLSGADVTAGAGFVVANALWGAIGVGVGALVRHQIAAIVGGIVWVLVIENLGASFLGDAGSYLPGQLAHVFGQTLESTGSVGVPLAAAGMTAYATAALLAGAVALKRRDVQ